MAVNRHITASTHQGGSFKAEKLPTITLAFFPSFFTNCSSENAVFESRCFVNVLFYPLLEMVVTIR